MFNKLELTEIGKGQFQWFLSTEDNRLLKCILCRKEIMEGIYCKDIERTVCRDCEFTKDRFCLSKEEEHIHHKVNIHFIENKENQEVFKT